MECFYLCPARHSIISVCETPPPLAPYSPPSSCPIPVSPFPLPPSRCPLPISPLQLSLFPLFPSKSPSSHCHLPLPAPSFLSTLPASPSTLPALASPSPPIPPHCLPPCLLIPGLCPSS